MDFLNPNTSAIHQCIDEEINRIKNLGFKKLGWGNKIKVCWHKGLGSCGGPFWTLRGPIWTLSLAHFGP